MSALQQDQTTTVSDPPPPPQLSQTPPRNASAHCLIADNKKKFRTIDHQDIQITTAMLESDSLAALHSQKDAQDPLLQRPIKRPGSLYGTVVPRTKALDVFTHAAKPFKLERIDDVLRARCGSIHIAFDNIKNPANIAASLRSVEGFGLQYVDVFDPFSYWVAGKSRIDEDCTNVSIKETASGAHTWLTIKTYTSAIFALQKLKEEGFTILGASLDENSLPLEKIDFHSLEKVVLIFGNEYEGMSKGALKSCDQLFYIPMSGFTESFNVSVSVGVTLQHLRSIGRIKPDLEKQAICELYESWVVRSLKHRAKALIENSGIEYLAL